MPDLVDWYRQEVLPRGVDYELQFAGSVLGHIRRGTSQQRCKDKLNHAPHHLRHLLTHSITPARPRGTIVAMVMDRPDGPVGRPELLGGGLGRGP